jgi:CLIP-associating protein 1/2
VELITTIPLFFPSHLKSILTLVHIRRAHHLFPIRPYLPLLVVTLEDGDAHVRECSRTSVVELFTGPGVTDAARADLKNAMIKANVRKGIVEGILAKLVGAPGHSLPADGESENGDTAGGGGKKEYVPPSMALQRRPTAGGAGHVGVSRSHSQSGVTRTTSQGNVRESSRPPSPAAGDPPDSAGSELKAVYVSQYTQPHDQRRFINSWD